MKIEKTPRQRIIENGDYYRALAPGLIEALANCDKASESGNLSHFIAALRDVSAKADTLGRTAASLAYLLNAHGVQPRAEVL